MGQLCCFHYFSLLFVGKLAFFNRPRPFFYPFRLDHLTLLPSITGFGYHRSLVSVTIDYKFQLLSPTYFSYYRSLIFYK